jgi:energy-coupling factor transporter ATP-binding protein EcfA2
LTFQFSIPTADGNKEFTLESGESIIFVGANGGGKTRLAVYIENALALRAHRISAHRALSLNPGVAKIGEKQALMGLRTGHAAVDALVNHRDGSRWGQNGAVMLLNDFDFLIQALFAEQSNTTQKAYNRHKPGAAGNGEAFQLTKLDELNEVWARFLPHRQLHISGDDILVSVSGSQDTYKASDMSDGERAIFYLIGQVLVAGESTVLIIDEPELHVHRSITSKLWDELEAMRPDCAFVFITHDLEFAAARSAQKFVIRDYDPEPRWMIEDVPADSGFDEELTTLILGSRRPILFVEGDHTSLDLAIYRCCYSEWTVIPRGSCSEVIHSVVTMRKNVELTRVTCSGIVDADDYEADDKAYFADLGIATLPVSEIENMILLPDVSRAVAMAEGYDGAELMEQLSRLSHAVFETVDSAEKIEEVVVRYCRRRIDRMLKKVDLSAAGTVAELEAEYDNRTDALDIGSIAQDTTDRINEAIGEQDLPKLLAYYDNKGLIACASSILKACRQTAFESWLTRALRNNTAPEVVRALSQHLPQITPS